eukprot:jgi/Picsp_1/27/NSC_00027-R1_hypothetical protein CHLNCDRAFT_56897 [Chlorella variabilis]
MDRVLATVMVKLALGSRSSRFCAAVVGPKPHGCSVRAREQRLLPGRRVEWACEARNRGGLCEGESCDDDYRWERDDDGQTSVPLWNPHMQAVNGDKDNAVNASSSEKEEIKSTKQGDYSGADVENQNVDEDVGDSDMIFCAEDIRSRLEGSWMEQQWIHGDDTASSSIGDMSQLFHTATPNDFSEQKEESGETQCYVILFGMGSEETEGIYTLRTVDSGRDGEPLNVDTVVAFKTEVDAQRFATLLEASLRHQPAVYSTSWADIKEWCTENNARFRLEPAGSLLIPPESNVSITDWERALALQRGEYSVLAQEPDVHTYGPRCSDAELKNTTLDDIEEEILELSFDFYAGMLDHDNINNIVDSKLAENSLAKLREDLERLIRNC